MIALLRPFMWMRNKKGPKRDPGETSQSKDQIFDEEQLTAFFFYIKHLHLKHKKYSHQVYI